MKILQICSKIPFPSKDGGSLAMSTLTNGLLGEGHEVQVLAINTPKHLIQDAEIDQEYRKRVNYRSVFIDTSLKPFDAFLNLFSSSSYNVSRFYSKDLEKTLTDILSQTEFDIVQLESIWVTPYLESIRKNSKAKIVLRSHNVEHEVWERLAIKASGLKKWYLSLLAKRLKKYELNMLNSYDAIVSITKKDQETFVHEGYKLPSMNIPFGFAPENYRTDKTPESKTVFHIGAMDWMPNKEAVSWMLNEVWPKVILKMPEACLHLAGRKMPAEFFKTTTKKVMVHGEVDSGIDFMKRYQLMVVPLSSGGGMRVKIIEGMALGKAVISTSIGAEGIEYEHEKNILIANTLDEFVSAILKCLNDPGFADNLGKNARSMVEEKYDNKKLSRNLSDFYKELLKK